MVSASDLMPCVIFDIDSLLGDIQLAHSHLTIFSGIRVFLALDATALHPILERTRVAHQRLASATIAAHMESRDAQTVYDADFAFFKSLEAFIIAQTSTLSAFGSPASGENATLTTSLQGHWDNPTSARLVTF